MNSPRLEKPPERPKRSLLKNLGWSVLGIVIALPIVAALVGVKLLQFKEMDAKAAQQVMPPEVVNATEVIEKDWQPRVPAVGSVVAFKGTVVSAEADGVVRQILFEGGTMVEAGAELVRLDVEIEQAQLRAAEAAADLARISFRRVKELIVNKSISQADFDSAEVAQRQANALVDNLKATIARKTVRAPFAGKLGIRSINVGQFLSKGNPVISLQSLDPVYVEFSLPQQRLGDLTEGLDVAVSSDAYPGRQFSGKVTAINPEIDPATRSVRVQATLANGDGRLRPGMFVSVDLLLANSETVLFIPATAVMHAPFGDALFVIEGEAATGETKPLVVRQQHVRLGGRHGDFVIVTEGVKAGDRIVSAGVFKLRSGASVMIDNTLAPEFSFSPKPGNT
jgi:membrane fusion protein (multidrug efflux system)